MGLCKRADMMKKAMVALMGLLALNKAWAVPLVPIIISAGLHMAVVWGIMSDYSRVDVKETASSTTPIKTILVATLEAENRKGEIEATEGTAPPTTSAYGIQPDTAWSKTFTSADGTSVSVSGKSPDELLQKMMDAPANKTGSPVVQPAIYSFQRPSSIGTGYLQTAVFNPTIAYIKNTTTKVSTIKFTQYVSCGYQCSTPMVVELTADKELVCPPGYVETAGTQSTTCTLSDPVAARASGTLKNNVCMVGRDNKFNPFDPDCASLQSKGLLKQETDADGNPAVVVNNQHENTKTSRVCQYMDGTPAMCNLSRILPNADGSYRREDTPMDPATGKPGPTNTEQPANPGDKPADYPKQRTGGGTCDPNSGPVPAWCSGTVVGGGGGGASLTPEQIAQGVKDGLKTDGEFKIGGDEQIDDTDTENNGDGIFAKVLDLKRFEVRAPNQNCASSLDTGPGTTLTFDMLGGRSMPVSFNLNGACQLIEPHEGLIKQTCEILWFIFAVFLFIRSTT